MHSRAALLIERELFEIEKLRLKGIEVVQSYEKFKFQWSVKIRGPANTLWKDGLFKLAVAFDESFSYKPPTIVFITIPFHPNVDPISGRLSIDVLENVHKWSADIKMSSILESVRNVLGSPQMDCVINPEAEDLFLHNRSIYDQLVQECVMVSRTIEEPLFTKPGNIDENAPYFSTILEYDEAFVDSLNTKESTKKNQSSTAHISFEDYHSTWSGIATSKPTSDSKNSHLKLIEGQTTLLSVHHGVKFEEIEDHLTRQLEQHKSFVYGNFAKNSKPQLLDEKISRMEQMRKIYLSQKTPSNLSRREMTRTSIHSKHEQFVQPREPLPIVSGPSAEPVEPPGVMPESVPPSVERSKETTDLLVANEEVEQPAPTVVREDTTIPPDAEVDELAKWAENLTEEETNITDPIHE